MSCHAVLFAILSAKSVHPTYSLAPVLHVHVVTCPGGLIIASYLGAAITPFSSVGEVGRLMKVGFPTAGKLEGFLRLWLCANQTTSSLGIRLHYYCLHHACLPSTSPARLARRLTSGPLARLRTRSWLASQRGLVGRLSSDFLFFSFTDHTMVNSCGRCC